MENQNQSEETKQNNLTMPMAIVAAGALIAAAIFFNSRDSGNSTVATKKQSATPTIFGTVVDISKVKTAGEPFVGNPNAPVVMAYWMDYQCPFCRRFEEDVISKLMEEYVKTGKLKIVFKDFQFLGPDSQTAGLAERAVWEVAPDKFYEWHKAMYNKQDGENSGWGNKADILALTESIGIDVAKVEQLMTKKATEYQKAMDTDKAEGGSFGINGTPGSIIGKNLISGAQPYAAVKQLIDLALQGK